MSIRKNTNPQPLDLSPELQEILLKNGMQARIHASSNGFQLVVQGHDSPLLSYNISEKQLQALTDWGTNFANKKAYNTFTSLVNNDFDMPKNFVHARNANGRVAMGLHGYRIGVGEYGRNPAPTFRQGWRATCMGGPASFLGWTPRQQDGFHLRRIGGNLYYPAGAPIVANRPDGRMKPGELQSGGYGFYYKGSQATALQPKEDVLKDLQAVIKPVEVKPRTTQPAQSYKEVITSPVYFTNEKWEKVLASHGLIIDSEHKTLKVQSAGAQADLQYDLNPEELTKLTSNSIKEVPVEQRLEILNDILKEDFQNDITMDMLNSKQSINIPLTQQAQQEINQQLGIGLPPAQELGNGQGVEKQNIQDEQFSIRPELGSLQEGGVRMDGKDLQYINDNKGWYREGRHGREVSVDEIRVEPIANQNTPASATAKEKDSQSEGKYRMTAVIDGKVVSHEITQKQYDKFMAIDDYHRMKLFSKVFPEVDMKSRGDGIGLGVKIGAAFLAGTTVLGELSRGLHSHSVPEFYMEHHRQEGPRARAYFKPGVDTPMDVAARNFEAAANTETMHKEMRNGV
ncbi:MAG: hypothetical protein ACRC9L_02605 [Brevinema sp.]